MKSTSHLTNLLVRTNPCATVKALTIGGQLEEASSQREKISLLQNSVVSRALELGLTLDIEGEDTAEMTSGISRADRPIDRMMEMGASEKDALDTTRVTEE
jgi:hypothetical protein